MEPRNSGNAPANDIQSLPSDPQMARLLGWLFVLIALPLAFFTLSRSAEKLASHSWPVASAKVLHSDMYHRTGRSGDWCLRLRYRYTVDGKSFSSDRISTSRIGNAGCDIAHDTIAVRFNGTQPGDQISIRYNPSKPETGIIYSDGFDVLDYFFPALALLLLTGGGWLIRQSRIGLG